ncbi:DUF1993 domain-containing protein [Kaistia dalseonensis]|uniref:DUF1993 domain-containing protein n=1 Tax=Kaistia dalseonensis TaxID=410840 RepID=A0ABU0HCI9_9HYPH|nr:DUF1993 domain-containing protein [Kaistia dalseonensis]MCX5497395.1 DUF1993 domain-containing protein [Kaistia dalseonensis]MDQ0440034.1 hypothetical protein [Kaistia dalseonensis]
MPLTMYEASVPVFIRAFGNLSAILDKGLAFAEEQGIDPAELVQTRLIDDMHPLAAQIQRASDTAKGCASRLSGIAAPAMEDNEATFADLKARIARTVEFLNSVPAEAFEGSETRPVVMGSRTTSHTFEGKTYLLQHALPNFFFHVTTAYAILRQKGVPIGKADYLGPR